VKERAKFKYQSPSNAN